MHDALRVHVGDALDELLKVDTSNVLVELALGHCVSMESTDRSAASINARTGLEAERERERDTDAPEELSARDELEYHVQLGGR